MFNYTVTLSKTQYEALVNYLIIVADIDMPTNNHIKDEIQDIVDTKIKDIIADYMPDF